MSVNKSPKTIATINFKGGVGKTTVTWCLADTLSTYSDSKVLMFDLDAQMSLTQAVGLNEDSGSLHAEFGTWYKNCLDNRRTIFDAIDQYTKPARRALQEMSSQLGRMETRVKRAFPLEANKVQERRRTQSLQTEATLAPEQALAEFDRIVALASTGATHDADSALQKIALPDLMIMAKELGVAFPKNKPSAKALTARDRPLAASRRR